MKRVVVVMGWLGFAVGLPLVLTSLGFSLAVSVQNAARAMSSQNYEQFVLQCAAIAIWLSWGYAMFSFANALLKLRSDKSLPLRCGGVRQIGRAHV